MLLSLLALAPLVAGHTLMTTLYVDGENQGDGVCIRQNNDPEKATFPISPLANDAMACGTPPSPLILAKMDVNKAEQATTAKQPTNEPAPSPKTQRSPSNSANGPTAAKGAPSTKVIRVPAPST